jgi:hypothetical protein
MMTPATNLAHDGIEQSITEWALDYGITPGIIMARLERGASIADAITMPMKIGHRGQRLPIFSRKQIGAKRIDGRIRSGKLATTYTHNGMTLSIPEGSRITGLKVGTIGARLRSGWDIGTALTPGDARSDRQTPVVSEIEHFVKRRTVESRLRRGWPSDLAMSAPPGSRMGRFAHGGRGVSSDFERSKGTGAGSTLQETPNITFSGKAENA